MVDGPGTRWQIASTRLIGLGGALLEGPDNTETWGTSPQVWRVSRRGLASAQGSGS